MMVAQNAKLKRDGGSERQTEKHGFEGQTEKI